ncbi:ShlB/FhaC/HecB family hemolysin secretion/activation protein [Azospirillum sp.]|uniref:ShlB/FhaC/HecB family hemolysin secretion/activation protein n=1 Tax=Azospirillum sp. TaxID=34012 RepID=UPI002D45AD5B|nr:ShlB/FhaC/HecB family hemolysin secretion/activation protein [Azospirillum sp.]HYD64187.1 ShlB/FhaC/HecB family hemolysin secretion/activation protein [Azospirillum sp.]
MPFSRRHPRSVRLLALLSAVGPTLLSGSLAAQPAETLPAERPGDARPALPGFARPQPFELPPPPPSERPPAIAGEPRVRVTELRVVGNTALPTDELRATAAPYLGRDMGAAELEELRRALTALYVRRGFINSGVVLPDQTVRDGIVTMQVVEGRLTAIEVSGLERMAPAYVVRRLERRAGPPLDIDSLREGVEVLLQDPLVDRLDARLAPGLRPGEGVLALGVREAPLLGGGVTISNDRSPTTGGTGARGDLGLRNLSGWGDQSWFRLARTRGTTELGAAVEMPVTAADTRVRLAVDSIKARVVEAPFSALDIVSKTRTLEAGISQPVHRTATEAATLDLTFAHRRSENWLLGEPFSFSAEAENGATTVSVLRAAQSWTTRGTDTVLAARSTFSVGLPVMGATRKEGAADGRFAAWLGQVQFARRFGDGGVQLVLRGDVQLASDALPTIERFAVGGLASVRGYRENLMVRDNALVGSVELRVPVAHAALADGGGDTGAVQVAAFADAGRAWNRRGDAAGPGSVWSVGTGVLWAPLPGASVVVYYGHGLRDVDLPGPRSLQDRGVHFRITLAR